MFYPCLPYIMYTLVQLDNRKYLIFIVLVQKPLILRRSNIKRSFIASRQKAMKYFLVIGKWKYNFRQTTVLLTERYCMYEYETVCLTDSFNHCDRKIWNLNCHDYAIWVNSLTEFVSPYWFLIFKIMAILIYC